MDKTTLEYIIREIESLLWSDADIKSEEMDKAKREVVLGMLGANDLKSQNFSLNRLKDKLNLRLKGLNEVK